MTAGKTNETGQLRPLKERLTPHQQFKRVMRMQGRQNVAEAIYTNQALLAGHVAGLVQWRQRGFWGRIKWFLLGR